MKEIRLAASDAVGVYAMAAMMEHSCMPNIKAIIARHNSKVLRTLNNLKPHETTSCYSNSMAGEGVQV